MSIYSGGRAGGCEGRTGKFQLLGLYPDAAIKVDDAILDQVPEFTFPEMELMEQIALMKRPELYEIDMQKHINVLECRKTIVMMFPNVRMFVDFTNSNNSFLYYSTWWELGIRAAYNLLKLPQHIARYQAYSAQVDAEEARTYAQAVAIMAQVRIAHANLVAAKERLDIDTKVYDAYSKNLKKAEGSGKISGELSQLELAHMRLATAETEIERYLSLGNYYVSYFRVLNTLGIENLHDATVDELKQQLETERQRAAEELAQARAEFEEEQAQAAAAENEVVEVTGEAAVVTVTVEETESAAAPEAAAEKSEPVVQEPAAAPAAKTEDAQNQTANNGTTGGEYQFATVSGKYDRLMGRVID